MNGAVLQASTEGRGFWNRQARKNLSAETRNALPACWRNLKIEATGDFWRGKVRPKIRLTGRWLERAGFTPGHRVTVELTDAGCLTLPVVGPQQ